MLEEGRSVTSVAAEFGIAHSIVSRIWRQFQTTGTAIRGFSSGRPRGTTPADDRASGDGPRNFEPWSSWTTPELAPPLLTTTPTGGRFSSDYIELMTCLISQTVRSPVKRQTILDLENADSLSIT
ncbi:hypothetical protein TNCV_336441 [Trichonephila clavipes]|nr:hypothetical protein TNCV_336441 [Trichonephila clavipes]